MPVHLSLMGRSLCRFSRRFLSKSQKVKIEVKVRVEVDLVSVTRQNEIGKQANLPSRSMLMQKVCDYHTTLFMAISILLQL